MSRTIQGHSESNAANVNTASALAPKINGPRVFGARVGSPFFFAIPVSGKRPIKFSAAGLPQGLALDPYTGFITGKALVRSSTDVLLTASNRHGSHSISFRVVFGPRIGLTPPLGWYSWNCWGGSVSEEKVLAAARGLVDSGLRDHGWCYVNVDDGWQGIRGGKFGAIQPNHKFPNMKKMADAIHDMGLKFGLYSTPWRGTYEGHIGSSCDRADGIYDWIESGDFNRDMRIGNGDANDWEKKRRMNYVYGEYSMLKNDVEQWVEWG